MEKLKIKSTEGGVDMKCPYNPTQLSYSRSVVIPSTLQPNSNEPKKDVKGGTGGKISFQLLLDTSEYTSDYIDKSSIKGKSVYKEYVMDLEKLLVIKKREGRDRTPYCTVSLGSMILLEKAVLTSLSVTYTLFRDNGLPIRAKADLSFEQISNDVQGQNPTSRTEARKTWLVVEGETLDWIAYKEYGDASQWRFIAESNNLADPLALRPGQLLKLLPLR